MKDAILDQLGNEQYRNHMIARRDVHYEDEENRYYAGVRDGIQYAIRIVRGAKSERVPATKYRCFVDFGLCEDDDHTPQRAWLALTGDSGEVLTPEKTYSSITIARLFAIEIAKQLGVPAHECDEMGPKTEGAAWSPES